MTIKRKLLLGFLSTAVLVGGVTVIAQREFQQVGRALQDTCDFILPQVRETNRAANAAVALFQGIELALDRDVASPRKRDETDLKPKLEAAMCEIDKVIKGLRQEAQWQFARVVDERERAQEREHSRKIDELESLARKCNEVFGRAIAASGEAESSDSTAEHSRVRETHAITLKLLGLVLTLQRSGEREIDELLAANARQTEICELVVLTVGGVAVVFALAVGLAVTRPLLLRLAHVRAQSEEIGRGNLDARVDPRGNDEITHLALTFNQMAQNLSDARRRFVHAADAADSANRAKSAFLANMSHEIRTPMTAIVGYSEMMLEPEQTPSDRLDCLQVIRRNARHLLDLINDMLDISKIEAGKMSVEPVACSLPNLAGEVVSMLRPRACEKRLNFRLEFDGPIPAKVRTDPLRARQILVNLIGNAIKFTDHGEILMRASCCVNPTGDGVVRFDIVDTGIGMSDDQVARLFQPFMQADTSMTRRFGGTGLGLTISRKLVSLLGGDITVSSRPGSGSTFTITMNAGPLDDVEMLHGLTEASVAPQFTPSPASKIELGAAKILLAEDGKDNQRLIATYLKKAGADVTIAENGRMALDMALAVTFDAIIMDMQMPEMDGYTATSELRRRGLTMPIVALTAHAMPEDRVRCLSAGCSDYLTKPVNRDAMLETLARHLAAARSLTTATSSAPQQPVASTSQTASPPVISTEAGPLRSDYRGDAEMTDLLREYVGGLPAQVQRMSDLLQRQQLDELRRAVHQLKGSGGGYGFIPISERAAAAEGAIKAGQSLNEIARGVEELISLLRRVEGYDPSRERVASPVTQQ